VPVDKPAPMRALLLPEDVSAQLCEYLSTKPYREVAGFLAALTTLQSVTLTEKAPDQLPPAPALPPANGSDAKQPVPAGANA